MAHSASFHISWGSGGVVSDLSCGKLLQGLFHIEHAPAQVHALVDGPVVAHRTRNPEPHAMTSDLMPLAVKRLSRLPVIS